jgi:hypothetical protein
MGLALGGLALAFIASFVLFAVFFGKYGDAKAEIARINTENKDYIGPERNRDDVRALVEAAKKNKMSGIEYLVNTNNALMTRVSGNPRDTMDVIAARLGGMAGSDQPIIGMVESRERELSGLRQQLSQAESAAKQARSDLSSEVGRVKIIEDQHKKTVAELTKQIGIYKDEVETYRKQSETLATNASKQMEEIRTAAEEKENELTTKLQKAEEQLLVVQAEVARLRGTNLKNQFRGQDEASLADARVIAINEADRSVVIGIGREQKAVLGMTFSVYNTPESIKPDDAGVYPQGKATLEIINVGQTSSVCRVTSELRGNPVVKGDVVANALYDPTKVYKFVVFGSFDTNRDGLATPVERSELESTIKAWGGDIVDDIASNADFLVLGERPVLPPRPSADAPLEVVLEFNRRFREAERYDTLFKQASSTGIPVLNENRLYTLTGRAPAGPRRAQR